MSQAAERERVSQGAGPEPPLRRAAVLAIALVVGPGLLIGIWLFARPLALVGIGIVLGEALAPIVAWGSRGLPRPAAVALLYLSIAAVLITLVWFALAPLVAQAQDLLNSLPVLIEQGRDWLQRQDNQLAGVPLVDTLVSQLQSSAGRLVSLPVMVVTSLFDVLLVLFLSLYWLLAAPQLGRFVRSLFPERHRKRAGEVQAELSHTVGGYVRGVGINVLIIAVLSYAGLAWIGLPFALVFAVIAGLLEIVPIVGSFIAGAIIVGFALSQSLQTALITLAFIVALQQLEGNVLTPMVMRSQTDIHPFLILVALVLGGTVGGLLGVLIAIPLAGAIKVLVVEVFAPALRRRVGAAEDAQ